MKTVKVIISGLVQGVGFRYFIANQAEALEIKGYAKNLPNGTVETVLQGKPEKIERLIQLCKKGPSASEVEYLNTIPMLSIKRFNSFTVL